jgi:sugar lactone lactonase YvrE
MWVMPWSFRHRALAALPIVALAGLVVMLPGGATPSSGGYAPNDGGPGTINTVAGKSPSGYSGDGGQARDAAMNEPRMLTFDGAGTMYIVDTFNQVIRRVGHDGVITTIAGHATGYVPRKDADCKANFSGENVPAREATMSCPHSAAVAANGDLFIADSANHVIRKVDHASGLITTVVGQGGKNGDDGDGGPATAAHVDGPKGIVFDANWNLLIADSGNDRIRRIDARTGVITTVAGTGETGVTGNGGPATAARLSEPRTLAVAPDGSIFFTEPKENIVRKIDPNGIITLFAGTGKAGFSGDGGPADKAQLNFNRGVNVDGAGTVWIADSLNQRIRKVDANGIITTAAGNGKACYYSSNNTCGDGGPAAAAGFAVPRAMEFDDAGNLFVADTFNERIRRIDNFAGAVRRSTAPGPT